LGGLTGRGGEGKRRRGCSRTTESVGAATTTVDATVMGGASGGADALGMAGRAVDDSGGGVEAAASVVGVGVSR